ncbi:MAG: tRNA lysidine(34) synthetase TilS [Mariprofundaceae bacterium]
MTRAPRLREARIRHWFAHGPKLPERVAVGLSGGADSTALLLALVARGHRVVAWHVDHGWRPESAAEAEWLAARMDRWGSPFFTARLESARSETSARAGRLACFRRWSRAQGVGTICLGHHRADQAETVCLRLLQGAGAAGCRGMARLRALEGIRLARPLLHVAGAELRAACREAGVDWLEDPSNADASIRRNRVRRRLFPAMRRAGVDPESLFLRLGSVAERLVAGMDAELAGLDWAMEPGAVGLAWAQWTALGAGLRARALQWMTARLLGAGATPGRRHVLLVEQWTARGGRGGLDLSRCRIERRGGRLRMILASGAQSGSFDGADGGVSSLFHGGDGMLPARSRKAA